MKKIILTFGISSLMSLAALADQGIQDAIKAEEANISQSQNLSENTSQTIGNIDCNYKISKDTNKLDLAIINKWAEKAAEQSFTFDAEHLNSQLEKLNTCFTSQGWQSFKDALKKSGNLDAITKQNLTVSAMIEGAAHIKEEKNTEWKVVVPLNVVYQNKEQKITQKLKVELFIAKQESGNLGIMQIIANSVE